MIICLGKCHQWYHCYHYHNILQYHSTIKKKMFAKRKDHNIFKIEWVTRIFRYWQILRIFTLFRPDLDNFCSHHWWFLFPISDHSAPHWPISSAFQTCEKLYSFAMTTLRWENFLQNCMICDIYKSICIYIYNSITLNNYKKWENIYLFMEVNESEHPWRKPVCSQLSCAF